MAGAGSVIRSCTESFSKARIASFLVAEVEGDWAKGVGA
jgi:hypothetical protein